MKLKTRQLFRLLFSLMALSSAKAFSAACCGGGLAAPALIVGDDKAQVSTSYSHTQITDDVGTDSLWRKRNSRETSETLRLEAAHIFQDLWQIGLSIPMIRRRLADESSSGLGDMAINIGYEYLPDWDYNPWRPRGLGYFQVTLPTGKSINESEETYRLDSRGRGYWALGAGTILSKIMGKWDYFTSLEIHHSFSKSYRNSQSSGTLRPGSGGSLGLGGGYSLAHLRLGGGIAWAYEDPTRVTGSISSKGSPQRYATATLSASYLLKDELAATLSYSDQTLFGSPVNTSLGRSIMLQIQKRWLR